jgi:hAT family C-terminal dimerisation region
LNLHTTINKFVVKHLGLVCFSEGETIMLDFLTHQDDHDHHHRGQNQQAQLASDSSRSEPMQQLMTQDEIQRRLLAEIDSYSLLTEAHSHASLMEIWKDRSASYPVMATIAHRILGIPATSVPCERMFSTTGVIVSNLRSSLLPDTVSKLLFLNKNPDL